MKLKKDKKLGLSVKKGIESFKETVNLQAETKPEIPEEAPRIEVQDFVKWRIKDKNGKPILSKTPPLNIYQWREKYRTDKPFNPPQMDVLINLLGKDPEDWNRRYKIAVIGIGMGGGKNHIFETFTAYQVWFICNLVDPYAFFEIFREKPMTRTAHFEFTNSSMVNKEQANEVFFNRIKTELISTKATDEDNWFQKYMGMDMREKGLGDIKKQKIEFPKFPTLINSGKVILHSLDSKSSSLEGKNIITANIDEPSRAETKPEYRQVKKLYQVAAGNATKTRFPGGVGKVIVFSYFNNSDWDLTYNLIEEEKRYRKAKAKELNIPVKEVKTDVYIAQKSTYEMRPDIKKEDNKRDYEFDKEEAECRYDSIKHKGKTKFLGEFVYKMDDCMDSELKNKVEYESIEIEKLNGKRIYTGINISKIEGDYRERCWGADPGLKKDSFTIVGSYAEQIPVSNIFDHDIFIGNDKVRIKIDKKIITDVIIEIVPRKGAPVDIDNVAMIIDTLLDKFPNSRSFNFDRFNSESLIQQIQSRGVDSKAHTFSQKDQLQKYTIWKVGVLNQLWTYTFNETLNYEGKEVTKEGNKIDHPEGGSKDVLDATIISYNDIIHLDVDGKIFVPGLERYTDARLFALADKFIIAKHEAKMADIINVKNYIIKRMGLQTEGQYDQLAIFVAQTYGVL